jgi:hypothetical protein
VVKGLQKLSRTSGVWAEPQDMRSLGEAGLSYKIRLRAEDVGPGGSGIGGGFKAL